MSALYLADEEARVFRRYADNKNPKEKTFIMRTVIPPTSKCQYVVIGPFEISTMKLNPHFRLSQDRLMRPFCWGDESQTL